MATVLGRGWGGRGPFPRSSSPDERSPRAVTPAVARVANPLSGRPTSNRNGRDQIGIDGRLQLGSSGRLRPESALHPPRRHRQQPADPSQRRTGPRYSLPSPPSAPRCTTVCATTLIARSAHLGLVGEASVTSWQRPASHLSAPATSQTHLSLTNPDEFDILLR
jgi:hypothetical protein